MISFFDLSSAGSVVRLASDTNGLSSTRAHVPGVVRARRGSGAHPSGGGGECAMAVSSDCLKGTLWLTKEGSFSST